MSVSSARSEIFIASRAPQYLQLRQERHGTPWADAAPDGARRIQLAVPFYKYFAPSGGGEVPNLLTPGICQN